MIREGYKTMFILGDVMAFIIITAAFVLAGWGTMVLTALLFSTRTASSARTLEHRPWLAAGLGLAAGLPMTVVVVMLYQLGGFFGLIATLVTVAVLGVAAFGAGGMARLVAERVRDAEAGRSLLKAYSYAAALIALACMLPLVGWFLVTPVVIVLTLGAGLKSLFAPTIAPRMATTYSEGAQ